ncbi:MAG: transglutaminase domain-containing protein [Oscillospiraceae bacterium]|nr:transglutaminase domain-containing protein [Oscillospiraceae bacterium]
MKTKKKVKFDGAAPLPIMLFLLSVCASLMYTLCRSQFIPCTLIMGALTAGIFLLFYKARFRPVVTTLSIFALVLAAWAVGSFAGGISTEDSSFMTFLFTASAQFDLLYAAAAIVIFSLVVGFIGCYFSVISPRPCFLMLLTFIPLILSFRTARALPAYFTLIMAACFVFASANLSVPIPSDNSTALFEDKSGRRRRIALSCAAAAVIGLATAIIPRPNEEPVFDTLDNLVPQDHGYFNTVGLSNFASHSSVNDGNNSPKGTLLFTVDTTYPGYLTRWVFDEYGEDGWFALDQYNTGYPGWEYNAQAADWGAFLKKVSADSDKLYSDNRSLVQDIDTGEDLIGITGITIRDGSSTRVVIHPTGTYRALLPEVCGRTYRTPRGDIFTENSIPANSTYYLRHHTGFPDEEYLRRVDSDIVDLLIVDAYYSDIITASEYSALSEDLENSRAYLSSCGTTGISDRIQALADEITAGCTSDYEKATALEKWFGEAGFIYDMEFVPEEKGVEYFLFQSRRGICSDYATALTLLARAAGLPARYCEGFVVSRETYDPATGLFNITDAQAHAWPQIYIPGAGWVDFDATSFATPAENDESYMIWLYIAAGAAALAILAFILRKPLGWLAFCISYPVRSRNSRIRGVYFRARRIAAELTLMDEQALSVGEVQKILTDRLSLPGEAGRICSAADRLFYSNGGGDIPKTGLLKDLSALKKRRRRLR